MKFAGVREAVVFGWPDKKGGEIAVAVILTFSPVKPDKIRAHCAKFLAANKVPGYIICVKSIPKTATGKVDVPSLKKIVKTKIGNRTTTPALSWEENAWDMLLCLRITSPPALMYTPIGTWRYCYRLPERDVQVYGA